jgi:hypothetical protein
VGGEHEALADLFKYLAKRCRKFGIGDPYDPETETLQLCVTSVVPYGVVTRAIHFDDKAVGRRSKIDDVAADRHLPPELHALVPPPPKGRPEDGFHVRRLPSHGLGMTRQTFLPRGGPLQV